jgi:hypothetical protein
VIVGMYDATPPITHGFMLDSRGFQTVDAPYGSQSEAASINDLGTIAGNSWTSGPFSGFLKTRNTFTKFDFPDETFTALTSINTFGDLGGYYVDSSRNGFMRLFGYSYVTPTFPYVRIVRDVNDNREILGDICDPSTGECQSFIGRPDLATGN